MQHILKILPDYFILVKHNIKTFEIRKNDRNYNIGDTLLLCEYNKDADTFTGNEIEVLVTYVFLGGSYGIDADYCIMSIAHMSP